MSLHIGAKEGEIADKVLMPGDPLRAKHIADRFLTQTICYNRIRGMYGFTGMYNGKRVSVQASGMGVPSISIYTHELLESYGVCSIIRVGTCGSMTNGLRLRDVLLASGSSYDNAVNKGRFGGVTYSCIPDFGLLSSAWTKSKELGLPVQVGQVLTSDDFYDEHLAEKMALLVPYGVLACEMETSELYTLAARFKAKALSILTVSDSLVTGEQIPALERQESFDTMVKLALEVI